MIAGKEHEAEKEALADDEVVAICRAAWDGAGAQRVDVGRLRTAVEAILADRFAHLAAVLSDDATVEAGARRAMSNHEPRWRWDEATPEFQDYWRDLARAVLDAVLAERFGIDAS